MATLAVVPTRVTLYDVEETLAAMIDTAEMVEPDLEAEFLGEFAAALQAAVEKRDRVAQFMAHLESQIELSKREVARLRERQECFEKTLERLKGYVLFVVDAANGGRKLEGTTVSFSSRKCPSSVEVSNAGAVPMEYQTVSLALPAPLLDQIMDQISIELADQITWTDQDVKVSKTAIKAALEAGAEVAGARLITDKRTLVRK